MPIRYPYHSKTASHLGGHTHSLSDSFAIGQGGYPDSGQGLPPRGALGPASAPNTPTGEAPNMAY